MKVLVISASPRIGGNSDALCDQFIDGARESGHETEKINITNKKIKPCFGCYACRNTSICVQKDDMAKILEKLVSADIIVLATPVYFYSMNAQMKMFIDRCLPRYREIKDKDFYFIITSADTGHEAIDEAIVGLKGFTKSLPGSHEKGIIYGSSTWEKGDILKLPAMEAAYEMGKGV